MNARRLLYLAALACLLSAPPLACRLAPKALDVLAPVAAADPFLEAMGALGRDYARAAEAAPDNAARDWLRRRRNHRAREIYRQYGRRCPRPLPAD